jgi:hypothetical protein
MLIQVRPNLAWYLEGTLRLCGRAVCWGTALQAGRSRFDWLNPSGCSMALGSTRPLTDVSARDISWAGGGGNNLTTFMCRLSRNSGSLALPESLALLGRYRGSFLAKRTAVFLKFVRVLHIFFRHMQGRHWSVSTSFLCDSSTTV